jgi:hypothetical protein
VNARWVFISPTLWVLQTLEGKKLGSLVLIPSSWGETSQFRGDRWTPLHHGSNYRRAYPTIRAAALDLESHLGVRSSDASAENRQRSALLP